MSLEAVARLGLLLVCLVALLVPAWWVAGRLQHAQTRPLFRWVFAAGLALVGYLSVVNLCGRLWSDSTGPATAWIVINACVALGVAASRPREIVDALRASVTTPMRWLLLAAVILALPQWLVAVSTPFWDEVASSAIHVTAPNQFADGVFPPRHNAFPDVSIKYHYAFTLLSGSLVWLAGVPADDAIDAASTGLWLFAFLFVFLWSRDVGLRIVTSAWNAIAALLGGGLSWLFLHRIETYSGFDKLPPASSLLHQYEPQHGVIANLVAASEPPSAYLRHADGSLSNLPWDIAAQFQQHAVAAGIAVALFALYALVNWIGATRHRHAWLVLCWASFGLCFLAHAVFGGVAAVAAGLFLLGRWLRRRDRATFIDGATFTVGVAVFALAHGGMLASGADYGASADVFTARESLAYSAGGALAFVEWNLAAFGVPLLLAIAGLIATWRSWARNDSTPRTSFVRVLLVFTAFAYIVPQLAYYSSQSARFEQFTEISKFFFPAHLGLALLSGLVFEKLGPRSAWSMFALLVLPMAITPLAFSYASATEPQADGTRRWLGFYRAPYRRGSVEETLANALRAARAGPREVYFDASADERRHGYLGELLIHGGSVFTLTPSRYERTGIGYRLSEDVVARRFVESGRMAMLAPGASACCRWYYARPASDTALAPLIVRSRFAKLLAEDHLRPRATADARTLYTFERATDDLDEDILRYLRPRVVAQLDSDWDGDGREELVFYDLRRRVLLVERTGVEATGALRGRRIAIARDELPTPPALQGQTLQVLAGRFGGDDRLDILVGRLADTEYRHGARIEDVVERSEWAWHYRDSRDPAWDPEYRRWHWDLDVPLVAAIGADGSDVHVAYRRSTRSWLRSNRTPLAGPALPEEHLPMPFAARFARADRADLALWGMGTGVVSILSSTGEQIELRLDTQRDDVLLPADYDGDGLDELAFWRPADQRWTIRDMKTGATRSVRFGASDSVPVPADYDGDGRVDIATWERSRQRILVSFDFGVSLGLEIDVPPDSLPVFVNLH